MAYMPSVKPFRAICAHFRSGLRHDETMSENDRFSYLADEPRAVMPLGHSAELDAKPTRQRIRERTGSASPPIEPIEVTMPMVIAALEAFDMRMSPGEAMRVALTAALTVRR
jgi:hypothetical protein